MILFQKKEIQNKARILRDHGMNPSKSYWHDEIGFNYRLTNMQAALGVAQLEIFDYILEKKIEIAKLYKKNLQEKVTFICFLISFQMLFTQIGFLQ